MSSLLSAAARVDLHDGALVLHPAHGGRQRRRGRLAAAAEPHRSARRRRSCRRMATTLCPPMKRATKAVRGAVEDLARRARLLDPAGVHQHHEVGQRHRLVLAMRDVHERDAELALQPLQLGAHLMRRNGSSAESGSSSSRICGIGDERAGQRDALLLAAGELRRQALGVTPPCERARACSRALAWRSALPMPRILQREGDVVERR